MQRNSAWVHGMKSDEKPLFFVCVKFMFMIFLETMMHVVIDRYFSLFLKDLNLTPEVITDSPFNM